MGTLNFSVLFHRPPSFFWKLKWKIQELVSTFSFLCAFSIRRQIFRTSNWQIQEFVSTLSFLCGFSLPPPRSFFFEIKVANPGVREHPPLSVCLSKPPPDFSHIELASPGVRGHPQLSVCLFTPPPEVFFSKSIWQIQELVGTVNFLCAICPPLPFFFGNRSGKSMSS